jgi:hypothetical protein
MDAVTILIVSVNIIVIFAIVVLAIDRSFHLQLKSFPKVPSSRFAYTPLAELMSIAKGGGVGRGSSASRVRPKILEGKRSGLVELNCLFCSSKLCYGHEPLGLSQS